METNEKIAIELQELNSKLDELSSSKNRYMVFSSRPLKFMWFNFMAGMFHMLGMIFGTAIMVSIFIYLFSRFNFTKPISNWIESTLKQVSWEKVVPQPSTIIINRDNINNILE